MIEEADRRAALAKKPEEGGFSKPIDLTADDGELDEQANEPGPSRRQLSPSQQRPQKSQPIYPPVPSLFDEGSLRQEPNNLPSPPPTPPPQIMQSETEQIRSRHISRPNVNITPVTRKYGWTNPTPSPSHSPTSSIDSSSSSSRRRNRHTSNMRHLTEQDKARRKSRAIQLEIDKAVRPTANDQPDSGPARRVKKLFSGDIALASTRESVWESACDDSSDNWT